MVRDHHPEAAFGELARRRRDHRVAQQALRRQHDERQRIDEQQRRLPAQQVEVLRRGRAVGDADVDVGRQLQEALRPRAGVIRSLTFVRVRQQQHERRPLPPLAARRDEELVDDDLRAVDEVAVLRFPDHQPRRLLHVVAVLEAEDRVLGQRAVVNLEGGARLRQRLQRHVRAAGRHVVQHGVAVAERAALDVLAGQADADAVAENRRQRQLLGRRPVDRSLVDGRRACARASRAPRSSFLWIEKSDGSARSDAFSSRRRSSGTVVFAFAAAPGGGASGSGSTKSCSGRSAS